MVKHLSASLLPVFPAGSEPAITVDLLAEGRGHLEELATLDAGPAAFDLARQSSQSVKRLFKQAEEPRSTSSSSALDPQVGVPRKEPSITPNVSFDHSSCSSPSPLEFDETLTSGYAADFGENALDPFGHKSAAAAAARARQAAGTARATFSQVFRAQFLWLQKSVALSALQARLRGKGVGWSGVG